MSKEQDFRPDWTSPPSDTIRDILEERKLSPHEFAKQMEHAPQRANELIRGQIEITEEIARRLEAVLGGSAAFWMARESRFQKDIARRRRHDTGGTERRWLREIPVGDMIRFGWLGPARPADELAACLQFFDVPNVETWRSSYRDVLKIVAYRKSPTFGSQPGAVAAWLRRGEIEAGSLNCRPWSPNRFEEVLSKIRPLTRQKKPNLFVPELQKHCAECGVAVVIVRAPTGCRASGATRFLSAEKALLLLSFRYLSDDHFWFSFFHEAGHLLIHDTSDIFLEGESSSSAVQEEQAGLLPNFQPIISRVRRLFCPPGVVAFPVL